MITIDSPTRSSTAVAARHTIPELVLGAWTLFVWGGRLRNIANDESLTGWALGWRAGLAAIFVGLALAVVTAIFVRRRALKPAALALATTGIVVWLVRGTDIALGDHRAAFIAVHTVLAVVTIALSVLVGRRWVTFRSRDGHHRSLSMFL